MNLVEMLGAMLGSNLVTGLLTAFFSRRKSQAEAVQVETAAKLDIAKTAMTYAESLEKSFLARINDLAVEIALLKAENIKLREKIEQLVDENVKLRLEIGKLTSRQG